MKVAVRVVIVGVNSVAKIYIVILQRPYDISMWILAVIVAMSL